MSAHPGRLNEPSKFIFGIYALVIAIGPLSIDMYLPAMPAIRRELGADVAQMHATMAVYLIGLALGQLIYGPLSDAFGRKRPLLLGLGVYVAASVGCAVAANAGALIALRGLQALGACAGTVTIRAMIRDRHEPRDVARALSLLTAVMGVAPIVAPLLGSAMLAGFGWRAIFASLALWATVMLLCAAICLPETRVNAPGHLSWRSTWRAARRLAKHGRFMQLAFAGAVTHSSLLAFLSSASMVFSDGYHLGASAIAGIFTFSGASYIAGAQINRLLLRSSELAMVMRWGMAAHLLASLAMVAISLLHWGGPFALLPSVGLLMASVGVVAPNAAALALAPFRGRAGMAASLMGFMQYLLAATTAFAVGQFASGSALPLGLALVVIGLLAQAAMRLGPASR